jgi:hypothetical protein
MNSWPKLLPGSSASIDDVAGHEKLFLAIKIVGKLRDHLAATRRQRQTGAGRTEGAGANCGATEAVWDHSKGASHGFKPKHNCRESS